MYSAALIDLDGTVYRGDQPTDGAIATIDRLRSAEISPLFLSNNPTKRPAAYREKLSRLGIEATVEEILNSGVVAARFLADNHPDASVYVIGEAALEAELTEAGIDLTSDPRRTDVVMVSLDRAFNYGQLEDVLEADRARSPILYATNPDRTWPLERREIPDCGAMIGAVEALLDREMAAIMGKPSATIVRTAMDRLGANPSECLMIGDRLDTDVVMGNTAGMTTVLVLSGVTAREDVAALEATPDYVIDSIGDIGSVIDAIPSE